MLESYGTADREPTENENHFLQQRYAATVPTAISANAVEVRYNGTVAVSGVSLEVALGSSLAVLGPNGSGKSTLLGALAGVVPLASGTTNITGSSVALVQQSTVIDEHLPMTARDVVGLARYASLGLVRRFGSADHDLIDRALARLRIDQLASRQLHELSGGERQRVMIAQGLAQTADVLILDEPLAGLDATSREIVLAVLEDELKSGRSIVIATHDLDAAHRFDQALLLETRPVAIGSPTDVLTPTMVDQLYRRAPRNRDIQIGLPIA